MKHLLLLAVLIYVTGGQAYCGQASDLRELTQLVDDINAAVVKADMTFLERVLHKDYVHYGQHGLIENRSQYLKNHKTGHVDYESLVATTSRSASTAIPPLSPICPRPKGKTH